MNYIRWTKGQLIQLSEHFNSLEFTCHCNFPTCINQQISSELINRAEQVRDEVGLPIKVTSGYRCSNYQTSLTNSGYQTAKNSQHVLGNAWDSFCTDMKALELALSKQFKAIGVALNFIHSDLRDDKERRWYYSGATQDESTKSL